MEPQRRRDTEKSFALFFSVPLCLCGGSLLFSCFFLCVLCVLCGSINGRQNDRGASWREEPCRPSEQPAAARGSSCVRGSVRRRAAVLGHRCSAFGQLT